MKCHYCGADTVPGEAFCRYCGTRQNPAPQPEPAEEPAAVQIPAAPVRPEQPRFVGTDFEFTMVEPMPAPPASPQPVQEHPRSAYVPYGAPERSRRKAPMLQLPTERGLAKMIFLGILTLGIYPLVIWCRIVTELNIAASRYDGERTTSYLGMCMLSAVTLMVYPFVWSHGLCRRIGTELKRRGIGYEFGPRHFWLWNVLGSLILVGPFIFTHKLMKAMNMLNKDYNVNG